MENKLMEEIELKDFLKLNLKSFQYQDKVIDGKTHSGIKEVNLTEKIIEEYEYVEKNCITFTGKIVVCIHKEPKDFERTREKFLHSIRTLIGESAPEEWATELVYLKHGSYFDKFLTTTHSGYLIISLDVIDVKKSGDSILIIGDEHILVPICETEKVYIIDCKNGM